MDIYVVHWRQCIDGEFSSGVLKTCYKNIESAREAMRSDFDAKAKEWTEQVRGTEEAKHLVFHTKFDDFRNVTIECDTFDYIDWNVERLTVE